MKEKNTMLTKEWLIDRLTQPCACGCGKTLGSELWFHPSCHGSAGLSLVFRQPQVLTVGCIACGSKVCDIATEEASASFFKKCHRKAPWWAKYEGGFVKVYCRICHKFIKKVRVAAGGAEVEGVNQ